MKERVVYINGKMLPESKAKISIFDIGFKYGAVFYEAMRTFNHKIFKIEKHLLRLEKSLKYTGLDSLVKIDKIEKIINDVLDTNINYVERNDDIFICVEITPGNGFPHPLMKQKDFSPTIISYTSSLPYELYAQYYNTGKDAVIVNICNVPPESFNPEVKNRSRLHFFLAKKQAEKINPDALALLPDIDGYITESTGANFFIVKNGILYTPTKKNIVDGISRETVIELAQNLGIKVIEENIKEKNLLNADEAFFTATTYCILPIRSINNVLIGKEIPGYYTKKLLEEWSNLVGLDIVSQAIKYANIRKISAPGQI